MKWTLLKTIIAKIILFLFFFFLFFFLNQKLVRKLGFEVYDICLESTLDKGMKLSFEFFFFFFLPSHLGGEESSKVDNTISWTRLAGSLCEFWVFSVGLQCNLYSKITCKGIIKSEQSYDYIR